MSAEGATASVNRHGVALLPLNTWDVPQALRERKRWVCWVGKPKAGGGIDKVPQSPATGWTCDALDEKNQASYGAALAAWRKYRFDGLGFALDPDEGIIGIDLDKCVDATGTVAPWARRIIEEIDSYTELSPSGTGIRILAFGGIPSGGRKRDNLEIYDSGRFLTITGQHLAGTPGRVEHRDFELRDFYVRSFGTDGAGAAADEPADYALDESEPPVRLQAPALRLWNGERALTKEDGTTDRSRTLYQIALELARAGATASCVANAVADRDRMLDFRKYSGRADGGALEYRRLAVRADRQAADEPKLIVMPRHREGATAGAESAHCSAHPGAATRTEWVSRCADCGAEVARGEGAPPTTEMAALEKKTADLEDAADKLREERDALSKHVTYAAKVLANPELRPQERITLVVAANEFAHKRSTHQERDEAGFVELPLGAVAERAGCSKQTASRCLKTAEAAGLIERDVVQVGPENTRLFIRLTDHPAKVLEKAATVAPIRPSHGGDRPRCPHHPDATVLERTTLVCRECGEIIKTIERTHIPDPLPEPEPAPSWDGPEPEPNDDPAWSDITAATPTVPRWNGPAASTGADTAWAALAADPARPFQDGTGEADRSKMERGKRTEGAGRQPLRFMVTP